MVRFALWPPFGDSLNLSDAELIAAYRDHALDFLERAATAGDPVALLAVHSAYESGSIPTQYGEFPVKRDPVRATAAGTVLLRLADPESRKHIEETLRVLSADIDEAGQTRALNLEREYLKPLARQVPKYNQKLSLSKPGEYSCGSNG